MKKINLMHIAEGKNWAGIEAHIFSLLSESINMTEINDVRLVSLYDGLLKQKLMNIGFKACNLPYRKNNKCAVIFQLKKQIENFEVNVLHTHGYLASIIGILATLITTRRVHMVLTFHQRAETHKSWKLNLYVKIMIILVKLVRASVIAVSADVKKSAVQKFKINKDTITVIHNGIDFRLKNGFEKDKTTLGLDPKKYTIGIVGRLVHGKGHFFFIELATALAKERDDIEFVILGDGPLKEEVDKLIIKRGMTERIRLMGHKDNILDYINSLTIMLMCSDHEGIPYVLLEAMMLRKPVVSTWVGGIPEVINNGFNGILVKPGDIKKMKKKLLELIEEPSKMILLGNNGYNTVKEKFSSYNMCRNTVNLYMKLILSGELTNDT